MTYSHHFICILTLYAVSLFTPVHANRLHSCSLMASMLVLVICPILGQVISTRLHPFFEVAWSSVQWEAPRMLWSPKSLHSQGSLYPVGVCMYMCMHMHMHMYLKFLKCRPNSESFIFHFGAWSRILKQYVGWSYVFFVFFDISNILNCLFVSQMSKGTDLTLKAIGDKTVLDVRKLLSKRTGLPLDHIQLRFRVSQFLGVGGWRTWYQASQWYS